MERTGWSREEGEESEFCLTLLRIYKFGIDLMNVNVLGEPVRGGRNRCN